MHSDSMNLYWGDAHTNLRPFHEDIFQDAFDAARDLLDFWLIAYYPFVWEDFGGYNQESTRQRPVFLEQWQKLCSMTAKKNEPGRFVCYPGYEWHGDRRIWGDHNVFYPVDKAPLDDAETLTELYEHLRKLDGIAIPHHTAYQTKERGADWSLFDEQLSPFAEIYSGHGCSEGYGSPLSLDRNLAMGPMVQAGSAHAGLQRGHHFGFIGSGDIHAGYPMEWNKGLMACYAPELTRVSLWDAFHARRVYAVTGDRIELDVSLNGLAMGQRGTARPPYVIKTRVEGADCLSHIQLLRNNVVIKSDFVSFDAGRTLPARAAYKLRCFFGWGPYLEKHPHVTERNWDIELSVENGSLKAVERLWMLYGQKILSQSPAGCRFRLTSSPATNSARQYDNQFPGMVFTIEGGPGTMVRLTINGKAHAFTIGEARSYPAVFAEWDAAETYMSSQYGITAQKLTDADYDISSIWHSSYKTHVGPAVHAAEFSAEITWEDTPADDGESWYYVRAIQANGQAAWSSPIWVTRA